MGKLYLYYKKHNDSVIGNFLKVKVDDNITAEVDKNNTYELELSNGTHNIKMYSEGWTSNDLVGYIDQDIEIENDTYYIYKAPATIYGKGKLTHHQFNSIDDFKKYVKKNNTIYKIVGIIFVIIAILILFIL